MKKTNLKQKSGMRADKISAGMVIKQYPENGIDMRLGQKIDIWVYRPDSVNTQRTILDEE